MVPGQDSAGNLLCIPCSGLKISLTCEDCGEEAALYQRARCYRCHFKIQLKSLLDDGSGDVSPELRPLFDALVAMRRAESGYQWLRNPRVRTLLSGLSSGDVELSHAGLDVLEPSRSVEYIRDLLMQVNALPHRDRHVAAFERWLPKEARFRTGRRAAAGDRQVREMAPPPSAEDSIWRRSGSSLGVLSRPPDRNRLYRVRVVVARSRRGHRRMHAAPCR